MGHKIGGLPCLLFEKNIGHFCKYFFECVCVEVVLVSCSMFFMLEIVKPFFDVTWMIEYVAEL